MATGTCHSCGCTDDDCRQCIEKTGEPCSWVEPDLCSACWPTVHLRDELDSMVSRGYCTQAEADEAFTFFDDLSDAQLRGEVSGGEALERVEAFAGRHLRGRNAS